MAPWISFKFLTLSLLSWSPLAHAVCTLSLLISLYSFTLAAFSCINELSISFLVG